MTNEELFKKLDEDLAKKKKALIIKGVSILVSFLIETAVIVAVIWLCVKQCS